MEKIYIVSRKPDKEKPFAHMAEYLVNYATPEVAAKGWKCIENNFKNIDPKFLDELKARIGRIKQGERDLYF